MFWDYENCAPPTNSQGYCIVNSIRSVAHDYGSVQSFRAYSELSQSIPSAKTLTLRSELQCSGVSLIDCPHNGRKDVADNMMIVDMMTFAMDTPSPATIILISGDRDFVYVVSVLRMRNYRVVLIASTSAHVSLKRQVSTVLDWEESVGRRAPRPSFHSTDGTPLSDFRKEFRRKNLWLDGPAPLLSTPTKRTRASSLRDNQVAPRSKLGHVHSNSVDLANERIHDSLAPSPGPSDFPSAQSTDVKNGAVPNTGSRSFTRSGEESLLEQWRATYANNSSEYQNAVDSSESSVAASPELNFEQLLSTDHRTGANNITGRTGSSSERSQESSSISDTDRLSDIPTRPASTEPPSRLGLDERTLRPLFHLNNAQDIKSRVPDILVNLPTNTASTMEDPGSLSVYTILPEPVDTPPSVPLRFLALLQILEEFRVNGNPCPNRGAVAQKLIGQCGKSVYANLAGVTSWKDYVILAHKAGFVVLGGGNGGDGDTWISLHPAWHGRVPPSRGFTWGSVAR